LDDALPNADQWNTPVWQYYKKHLPPSERTKPWAHVVRETRDRSHKSYYHPAFLGRIEELETTTLHNGILLYEDGPVRYYWREFEEIIGASCGEVTMFILVECHMTGPFHGHPVTWEELRKKGASDEDRRDL
jgi:hypothetical protein